MFLSLFKPVARCSRCAMQYAEELDECPHCRDFSDAEMADFLQRRDEELNNIAGLGRIFLLLALLLLLVLLGIWI